MFDIFNVRSFKKNCLNLYYVTLIFHRLIYNNDQRKVFFLFQKKNELEKKNEIQP